MRSRLLRHSGDRLERQSGQAIVLIAFVMVALIAMTALVMSAGALYWQRRQAQELADAAALAGATQIPCSAQNAYLEIGAVVSAQLGGTSSKPSLGACQTPSSITTSMENRDAPTWSQTYSGGTTVRAWYPYQDGNHIEVVVTQSAALPTEGLLTRQSRPASCLTSSSCTVTARAVAMTMGDSFPSSFALYAQDGISCDGSSPINVYGSVYAGTSIDSNCTLYAHAALAADGTSVIDQGNVLVQGSAQQWSQGGGACSGGQASGNAVCADGYEESASSQPCPTTTGVTDYLGASRIDYPCPTRAVPALSWTNFPLSQSSSEPNDDPNVTAGVGGACPLGSAGATVYQPLKLPGTSTVIGSMARQQSGNAPTEDQSGYWHIEPGCYGWLDLSRVGTANPVVFDPGFFYFSGSYASPGSYGGLCLGTGTQALGNDVLFEFTSTSSMSTSTCGQAPSSATSSGLGANPAITVGGVTYGALGAPNTCDQSANPQCSAASTWCPVADPVCDGLLVWAPPFAVNQLTTAISGTFFAKGNSASALDGTVFWPGACSWTANYSSTITGQLLCQSTELQGGKGKLSKQGMTIHFGGAGSNTLPSNSQLTE